jgi:hypothetical protein
MRLARSSGFFRPANTILVPGMYLRQKQCRTTRRWQPHLHHNNTCTCSMTCLCHGTVRVTQLVHNACIHGIESPCWCCTAALHDPSTSRAIELAQ